MCWPMCAGKHARSCCSDEVKLVDADTYKHALTLIIIIIICVL